MVYDLVLHDCHLRCFTAVLLSFVLKIVLTTGILKDGIKSFWLIFWAKTLENSVIGLSK